MKKILAQLIFLTIGVSLVGCSNTTLTPREGAGAVAGGVAGGLIGYGVAGTAAATGVGVIAGALIGGAIGRNMDENDQMRAYESVKTGKKVKWKHARRVYMVEPISGYVTVDGNPNCREFVTTAIVNGHRDHVSGVACMQGDGSWRIVR